MLDGHIDLQEPPQKGNIVGPFLLGRVPGCEGALDALRKAAEALVLLLQRCQASVSLYKGYMALSL